MKNWIRQHKVIAGLLFAFLALDVAAVAFVWGKLGLIQYDEEDAREGGDYHQHNVIEKVETPESAQKTDDWAEEDVMNILLVGTDEHRKEFVVNARSDSMILASLNKKAKTIKLVSLQRGIGVPVLEGVYQGQYDWLTHIFRYGGADLLMKTVRECFHVNVDRYVRVNLSTMTQVVEALGGVDIELTETEAAYLSSGWGINGERMPQVKAGMNHLNGEQALSYARLREPDSDWRRVERQRNIIVQCLNQLRDANVLELNDLANKVLPLVKTNFNKQEIAELMLMAPGFLSASVDQMTIPVADSYTSMEGMGGRTLYDLDFELNNQILHDFLYGKPEES